MGQRSKDLGRENQTSFTSAKALAEDMDRVRRSPYRPAASRTAASKGLREERTRSPDHQVRKLLAPRAATREDDGPAMGGRTVGADLDQGLGLSIDMPDCKLPQR